MLFSISLHNYLIPTDKLIENLVKDALNRDKKENMNKAPSNCTSTHLDNLVTTICNCGVSFNVWEKPNADGRASGVFDWTSLMGRDKKILLEKLPSKLYDILTPDTSGVIIQLWKVQYPNAELENNGLD